MRFTDRVVVVIGGTSGIGRAAAERFSREGATVVVASRREQTHEPVSAIGERVSFVKADVSNREEIDALFAHTASVHGRLDVMVNCAGLVVVAPTMSVTERHWQRTIDINMNGVFRACQAAIPYLRDTISRGLAAQASRVR